MNWLVKATDDYDATLARMLMANERAVSEGKEKPFPDPKHEALEKEFDGHEVTVREHPYDLADINLIKEVTATIAEMENINQKCANAGREPQFRNPGAMAMDFKIVKRDGRTELVKREESLDPFKKSETFTVLSERLERRKEFGHFAGMVEELEKSMTKDETRLLMGGQLVSDHAIYQPD